MIRLVDDVELVPVVWLESGLIAAGHPPIDAPESVWRQAHQDRLDQLGLRDVPLLWGRPPWARLTDLPGRLPEGIHRSDTGIALVHKGVALVLPGCCTGFEDLSSWREAVEDDGEDDGEDAGDEWEMLWIGHPWIRWRRDGDDVWLTTYCEADPVAAKTARWAVSVETLREAVDAAQAVLVADAS
jgi:hypothetical protein